MPVTTIVTKTITDKQYSELDKVFNKEGISMYFDVMLWDVARYMLGREYTEEQVCEYVDYLEQLALAEEETYEGDEDDDSNDNPFLFDM